MDMNRLKNISKNELEYNQYTDYIFKRTVQKYANGVLKFLKIPYEITNMISSELTSSPPHIHRMDFVGEAERGGEEICIILECQSKLPNDDDITRFFQYVSSLRVFKNRKVELYILCTEKAPYTKREFIINDECVYTMHVISLKDYNAREILKSVEDKIRNNETVTDETIACLQLIAYTDYSESTLKILIETSRLIEQLNIDMNEKEAVLYVLNVLSTNMLNETEKNKFMEERKMMINPRDEYLVNKGIEKGRLEGMEKGRLEVAKKLLEKMTIKEVSEITGLSEKQIEEL